MAEAVFALIGVVVGGVLIAGSQWLSGTRDQRRRQRMAARIMSAELTSWRTSIGDARRARDLSRVDHGQAVLSAWNTQRAALTGLKPDEWRAVHLAIRAVESFSDGTASGWPRNASRSLANTAESVQEAIDALESVAALSWLAKRRGSDSSTDRDASAGRTGHGAADSDGRPGPAAIALYDASGHARPESAAALTVLQPGQGAGDGSEEARSKTGRGTKTPRPGQLNLPGLG